MDAQCATEHKNSRPVGPGETVSEEGEEMEEEKEEQLKKHERERPGAPAQSSPLERTARAQSAELAPWTCRSEGEAKRGILRTVLVSVSSFI